MTHTISLQTYPGTKVAISLSVTRTYRIFLSMYGILLNIRDLPDETNRSKDTNTLFKQSKTFRLSGDNYVIVEIIIQACLISIILFYQTMEDSKRCPRKNSRQNTLIKDGKPDAEALFTECQQQLHKLNKQLGLYFQEQRHRKIMTVLPSIQNIGKEIAELKQNISYEATPEETLSERASLAKSKQILLQKLKGHSKRIEQLKNKVRKMAIISDELVRQYQENKFTLENHPKIEEIETREEDSYTQYESARESIHSKEEQASKKMSFPSVFSPNRKITNSSVFRLTSQPENQTKWAKIDKLIHKISALHSDALANKLLKLVKLQKGGLKNLMKNYQVTGKMGELLRNPEVKEEWVRLDSRLMS